MEKKKKQIKSFHPIKPIKNPRPINSERPRKKNIQMKPKGKPEDRLSDLEKTLDINIQIFKTYYGSSNSVQSKLTKESAIINSIDKIKKLYLKKKELFNSLKEKKSKSLIESQIYAEKKRKIEELKEVYQSKIIENQEGLNTKDENIKKMQKRLKEVEIYIHKYTLNLHDRVKQKYYQEFVMNDFLDINNDLARKKDLMSKNVESIRNSLQAAINENKLYKNKTNEEKTNNSSNINIESEIKKSESKESDEGIKRLSEKYNKKIELMNSRINLLKNTLQKIDEQFRLFDLNKLIKKSNNNENINIKEEENKNSKDKDKDNNIFFKKIDVKKKVDNRNIGRNKSKIEEKLSTKEYNDDFNNRMNSYIDFSMLNNDDENNISKEKFGIMKNSFCDISAINDKDISIIEKNDF